MIIMKLKQLLEQLNQLAKERPEALEMAIEMETSNGHDKVFGVRVFEMTKNRPDFIEIF